MKKELTKKEVLKLVKKEGDILFSLENTFWHDSEIVYQATKEIYVNIDDWDAIIGLLNIIKATKVNGDEFIRGHEGLHLLVVKFLEQENFLYIEFPGDYEKDLYKMLKKWKKGKETIRGTFKSR